jgi:hypothetical protein
LNRKGRSGIYAKLERDLRTGNDRDANLTNLYSLGERWRVRAGAFAVKLPIQGRLVNPLFYPRQSFEHKVCKAAKERVPSRFILQRNVIGTIKHQELGMLYAS